MKVTLTFSLFLYIELNNERNTCESKATISSYRPSLASFKPVSLTATMYYLVHTTAHTRPFITSLSFVAQDYRAWGYQVDSYPHESKYIAEIQLRERLVRRTEWRVELIELWSREVIRRKTQERERGHSTPAIQPPSDALLSPEERRIARTSSVAQDFVDGVAAFGECGCEIHKYLLTPLSKSAANRSLLQDKPGTVHTPFPFDPRPIPQGPLGLISKTMRLLAVTRYTPDAALPPWSNPDILVADQLTLEFRFHAALKKEHLVHAVNRAVSRNLGRMGRVEKDMVTGNTKVWLFVDVADCVVPQDDGADGEMGDPVPVYERGEGPPPYV